MQIVNKSYGFDTENQLVCVVLRYARSTHFPNDTLIVSDGGWHTFRAFVSSAQIYHLIWEIAFKYNNNDFNLLYANGVQLSTVLTKH